MATTARLDLSVWRNDDSWEFPLLVRGPNLTGVPMRAQIRMIEDTPGAPLADLATVTNGNAEGIRLAGATEINGVWENDVRIRLNKSTRQALPYMGEVGESATLKWAMQIGGRTRLVGSIIVLAHAIDSNMAPTDRPPSLGGSYFRAAPSSGASLTIAGDDVASLSIDGFDLIAPLALGVSENAEAARAAAATALLAQAAALVSGKLYDTTAAGLAGTSDGGYFLVRAAGDRFADLYRRSGSSAVLQPNQLPSAQAIADKLGTDETRNVTFITGAGNPEAFNVYVQSNATGKQVDGIYGYHEVYAALGSAGYVFHGVTYSDVGVPNGVAGGIGGAIGGPGGGSGVVGNRRDSGIGAGVSGTRAETGDGAGVQGSFQSTGTGAGGRFLKQNTNGAPGGPSGTGPALEATNSSEQGEAISSTTTENNGSAISNLIQRLNFKIGIIARLQMLVGGARSGFFTALDVLINPGSAWTGTAPVNGINVSLNGNVQGAGQRTAVNVSNAATGATASYSFAGVTSGANDTNYGGYFGATGATNNFGLYVASGSAFFAGRIQAANLPVFADNAAASVSLQPGEFYRTAAGDVKARV
jgi:hypothetical protein